ncbi:MAG: DUF6282 family protein [Candidatus Undinarchaeales archaeon]|nr:DUF6282 family protein [Candidatus Undinarchaeales archaeon]MDP7493537.1 DUF6282 family protein [Candidatus Undinarchaeales archaeon]
MNGPVEGAWDIHVHAAPSLFPRATDAFELVRLCRDAGMGGVVLKSHHGSSVEVATLARERYPDIIVYGGVTLNNFTGGLNPAAVECALALGGRIVWLPTIHARHHIERFEGQAMSPSHTTHASLGAGKGLTVLDRSGELLPETRTIIDLVADRGAVLATGHLSPREVLAVHDYAREERSSLRLLVDHVFFTVPSLSIDQIRELIDDRTWFELSYYSVSPLARATTPTQVAVAVTALPDAQWIMVSDTGQVGNPLSPDALARYCQELARTGVPEDELVRMVVDRPRRLVGSAPGEQPS